MMGLTSFAAFAASMFVIFGAGILAHLDKQGPMCYQLNMETCDLDLDIQLVTDMSGMAGEDIHGDMMKYIAHMLEHFDIGPYHVRIGHIAFSNITENKFNMSTFETKVGGNDIRGAEDIHGDYPITDVTEMKGYLLNTTEHGDGRNIGDAMEQAWLAMQQNGRKSSQKAYMVFTTGNSSEEQLNKTKEWAEKMRDDGKIFSFGLGMKEEDRPILNAIANGNDDYVFIIKDGEDFLKRIPTIVRYVCALDHVDCIKCQAHAVMHNMRTGEHHDEEDEEDEDDDHHYVPQCVKKNNRFKYAQVDDHERWCVLPDGTEIQDTRQDKDMKNKTELFDCEAMRAEAMLLPCQKRLAAWKPSMLFKPTCYSSCGFFSHQQCLTDLGYCWCSLLSGTAIPGTIWHENDAKKPDCMRHRDLMYSCINKDFTNKAGTFKHPFDPKRYVFCDNGNEQVSICHCPHGLVYNEEHKTCAWKISTPKER